MKRRTLLKSGLALALSPGLLALAGTEQQKNQKDTILVVVFQRGGMDGLMAVPPFDDRLAKFRPQLAMTTGKGERGGLIRLNRDFGLHPAFSQWDRAFGAGEMAVIHGVGLSRKVRSHFDAQAYMETGSPTQKGPRGWIGQIAEQVGRSLAAVAMQQTMPLALAGTQDALALQNLDQFVQSAKQIESMGSLYAGDATFGREVYQKIIVRNWRRILPGSGYPRGETGRSMSDLARLLKADLGIRLAFVTSGGWDTHRGQGTDRGAFSRAARDLAGSINAFRQDLAFFGDRLMILTMTEFGRTVAQNGSGGTDHGRGSCFFAFGTGISGGEVYGQAPQLRKANLEDERDLPVTTDFRTVLAEVITDHLGLDPKPVFGDLKGKPLSLIAT